MSALNPLLSIGDQVAETVTLHRRVARRQALAMARAALDAVGLSGEPGALTRYPHELSGGQRQRVALAIALVLRPALLIADEPTTALDAQSQSQLLRLLRERVLETGMGLVLISHDLAVIAQAADRMLVMEDGAVVERSLTPRSLRGLEHPYSQALLAAAVLHPKRLEPVPAEAAATLPILEARGIVVDYPRPRRSLRSAPSPFRAVDGVCLDLRPAETVGLVGESGSGKSSLLRALLALARPQAGEVRLLGENLTAARGADLHRLRRSIQAVFQDPYGSFDPRWTVERLIAEPLFLMPEPPSAADYRARVAAALEAVGLPPTAATRLPREFSGGQRQRIAIARALITEPAVIVFDEAVSALDVLVRRQIIELLQTLSRRRRLAYLFVSHDLNLVRSIADRVYVMQAGRIVEQGTAAAVFACPQHPYTRMLLAAAPALALS